MKSKSILLLVIIFTLMSCENEEIYNNEEGISNFEMKATKERIDKPECPPPVVTLSPCDQKFRFFINRSGSPDLSTFEYRILDPSNSNNVIDFGNNLSYGQYTNTVTSMQYCHEYIFEFQDWCWPGWTQIYVISDGCGNIWLC